MDDRVLMAPTLPPRPIANELARPHLVDRLAARWTSAVTLVVAGPGFGKSTILAQAMRVEALEPSGIEGWTTCQPGYEQAGCLAAALVAALGCVPRGDDPLADVLHAIREHSPLDVCLIIDDVHEIPAGSSSAVLLGDLVRRLPAHAHLVLAGREIPALPLAHLRAAGRLTEIASQDLVFDQCERARLATRLGRAVGRADRFDGWPALVRLSLAAGDDRSLDYAREEVLAGLSFEERRTLFGLVMVGIADDVLVSRVTSSPVDLNGLADRVPLVTRVDDVHFRAHELWLDALVHTFDATEVHAMQARAVQELSARGDLARAGALALTAHDWEALDAVALELVRTTISVLPVDTAHRWLEGVPPDRLSMPGLRLLSAALFLARDYKDASVDCLIDAAADDSRALGDTSGEVVALALGTVAAQARCDVARLLALASRSASVPGAHSHPIVRLANGTISAVMAEMSGNPEAALDAFAETPLDDVPSVLALFANRFLMHCLLLSGRADEAVEVADHIVATGAHQHMEQMPVFTRWLAGDPSPLLEPHRVNAYVDPTRGASSRDAFLAAAFQTVILASFGRRSPLGGAPSISDFADSTFANPRDAAVTTNARAARALVEHDEAAAATAFDQFIAEHGDNELGQRHLRRFLALGYVLNPQLRTVWDSAPLGPSHEQARTVARALLRARAGRRPKPCDESLSPPVVLTALPLPWSVELACRLHGLGAADGQPLAAWLVDNVGEGARDELRHLAGRAEPCLARQAAALLGRLPIETSEHLEIAVLGPLEIRRNGGRAAAPELRRARVRELLAVLVVEPNLNRDRAVALLWPELDTETGGRNLRVTLAHLRRLLEPDRPSGEASFHLRADGSSIQLFASPKLTVDLWELRRLSSEAVQARRDGDIDRAIELFDAATSRWRSAPLTDLDRLPGFDADVEAARLLQLSSLLELGALQLTRGAAAEALTSAERALAIDPYLEQAHRLAIGANVHRHDPARIRAVVDRAKGALDDLGVTPEPATAMLMRHATAQLDGRTLRPLASAVAR
jgi:DNA-binding SARP family transcriptional activator